MKYLAHKRNETDGKEQLLKTHLENTAELCSGFAKSIGMEEYGRFLGMLHDIGKYSEAFQKRIRGENIRVDHSTAGAKEAYRLRLLAAVFCISGHHGGLPDIGVKGVSTNDGTLHDKMNREPPRDYSPWLTEQTGYKQGCIKEENPKNYAEYSFLIRFLFSCLTDADFLDTESFMSDGTVIREKGEGPQQMLEMLDRYILKFADPTRRINRLRVQILNECILCGKNSKESLFTLTVPTGGGKTISSLAFALNYAVAHNKKRVIYVIPYTSIIEQNAEVFRQIVGAENIVENHSNIDFSCYENSEEMLYRNMLACENWEAPIIVTTAVQFFESLYSNKPGKCRKIHNIADSVIIFDEAQMLPLRYLSPCVFAIWQLVKNYNSAAVLCTATQPSLERFFDAFANEKVNISEICPSAEELQEEFKRAEFKYDGKLEDDELAAHLTECSQVLCIVNKKAHAQKLFSMIGESEENFHLSTLMYPEHRKKTIELIKKRLKEGLPCRVISTSLIEAGVDIDFPTVYRAVAGIDSILQAGGRCNRENKNDCADCIVHIFNTDEIISYQEKNVAVAQKVIDKFGGKIYLPEAVKMYFDELYYYSDLDNTMSVSDSKEIIKQSSKLNFAQVAEDFKLIESNTKTVYILTDESRSLIDNLRAKSWSKALFRRLQSYAVNMYEYEFKKLDEASAIENIEVSYFVLVNNDYYDEKKGVVFPDTDLGQGIFA